MDWCGGAADPLAVLFFCVCFVWVLFCLFVFCLVVAGGLRAPWPLYVFLCFVGMLCAPRLWIRCIILVREVLWRSFLAPSFAEFITVLF